MTAFDVCVIGSGPAGGVLSKELAEAGAKVALVEAGPVMPPESFQHHGWPYQRSERPGAPQLSAYPPELVQSVYYKDCDDIAVDRIRAVGGRSIYWNAVALRFAERDFRERSLEGVEEDWPLTYPELAPYYSYVERMIGVTGSRENLEILPDGEFLPPLKLRCSEEIVKRACAKLGIPMIPTRKALLTVPYDDRPSCHYCGRCMEGCDVAAIFTVPGSMLPKARQTGNFTLLPGKLARELRVDPEGNVRAVSVVDTLTRREEEIRARIFAVCCSTIESPRLLLNSRSPRFPNGLANSSDAVGRNLAGHVSATFFAYLDDLVATAPVNNDGATSHALIPRFNLGGQKRDYAGGFKYQTQDYSFMFPDHARYLKGFGKRFKREVRELEPGFFALDANGKVLARPENRVTIDPSRLDPYGIPISVVHFRFGANDKALWKDMDETAHEILHTAGVRLLLRLNDHVNGLGGHDGGTVRMGRDPRTSVLNAFCQTHDVRNLFLVDGSSFTTLPEKTPTLTIMALAVRAARYITSEVRKGSL